MLVQTHNLNSFVENSNKLKYYNYIAYLLIFASACFHLLFIARPLIGHYDSDGHYYHLMAKSFYNFGHFKLGFIPVNNSGPLSNPPDYYTHWPFLFPNLLGAFYKFLGPQIYIGRLITLIASGVSAWVLFDILKKVSTIRLALLTVFFYIIAPLNLYYGFWVGRTVLALCFWLLAVRSFLIYCHDNFSNPKSLYFALGWFLLASFTSWEPVVTIGGLVIIFIINKNPHVRRGAILCSSVLAIAFVLHHLHILLITPNQIFDQLRAFLERASITNVHLPSRPLSNWLFLFSWNMYISFGLIILSSSFLGIILIWIR